MAARRCAQRSLPQNPGDAMRFQAKKSTRPCAYSVRNCTATIGGSPSTPCGTHLHSWDWSVRLCAPTTIRSPMSLCRSAGSNWSITSRAEPICDVGVRSVSGGTQERANQLPPGAILAHRHQGADEAYLC